jgi:hypothetical protein
MNNDGQAVQVPNFIQRYAVLKDRLCLLVASLTVGTSSTALAQRRGHNPMTLMDLNKPEPFGVFTVQYFSKYRATPNLDNNCPGGSVMKRLLLVASCIALSACSTYSPRPGSSPGYDTAYVSGIYAGGYPSNYSNSTRFRGSINSPYGGYSPHYYRNHGFGRSSSITLGLGYDWSHRSSYFGGHRNSLGYGSGYRGHSLGHSVRHRRRH